MATNDEILNQTDTLETVLQQLNNLIKPLDESLSGLNDNMDKLSSQMPKAYFSLMGVGCAIFVIYCVLLFGIYR